jgi:Glycine/serine hydroxymethyltransferase
MCDVIENMDNDEVINEVKNKVVGLCKKFPVYGKSQSKAAAA